MIWMNKDEVNRFWWFLEQGYPFLIFDVETTGLKKTDFIVQFSGMRFEKIDGAYEQTDFINEYIKPPVLMDQAVMDIHHITNEFLDDKPNEEELFEKIKEFFHVANCVVSGYNVSFDIKMMKGMFARQNETFEPELIVDGFKIAKNMLSKKELGGKRRLVEVAAYYEVTDGVAFHSAEEDIKVTWDVMIKMLNQFKTTPVIPEETKAIAQIESMKKYEKGMYVKRIYVTAKIHNFIGELYYDVWNDCWCDTNEDYSAIEKFNMKQFEKDALSIINELGFKKYSSFKGTWEKREIA